MDSFVLRLLLILSLIYCACVEGSTPPIRVSRIAVVLDTNAPHQTELCAELLVNRILRWSQVDAKVVRPDEAPREEVSTLRVYLGRADSSQHLADLSRRAGMDLPTVKKPGPEGFALKVTVIDGKPVALAAGVDDLGNLYAAGELLRRFTYHADAVEISEFGILSAPAYRWRGSSANQGGTMMELTGARQWTKDERHDVDLEHVLAGANTVYCHPDDTSWAAGYGLKVERGFRPNGMPGRKIPPEWRRKETERGEYVCPSIPEARKALIDYYTTLFSNLPDADVVRFFAGDPGGCRCDLCQPWGKTFMQLCAELAVIWKQSHPNSEIQIANQDVDNAGDAAIFASLNQEPHSWLNSISYGPGSNAMSSYFRPELRDDLFVFPAHGPLNRYLAHTLHNLPKDVSIVHYSDITHWISAQYQVEHPDPYAARIYGRRTFHQRPRAFYHIFNAIMPFSEGDIIYSEGYHDEFHQFLWNRMLWNPNRTLDDLMMEYAVYYFGREAAPEMVQASLQLEENLEKPLETNPGIDRYYQLVKSAGPKIPANLMAVDHRWRSHMQKASLDRFFQLRLRREQEISERVTKMLEGNDSAFQSRVKEASAVFSDPFETPEMTTLRQEALLLADESNRLFGLRNEGIRKTELDLTGLAWFKEQIQKAAAIDSEADQREAVETALHYEQPGEGGFYDDAGESGRQPHLVQGENLWNPAQFAFMLDPSNRPTANTFVYNRSGPVRFVYEDLDPAAAYTVRVTLVTLKVTPQLLARFGVESGELRRTEDILADDAVLAKDLEVPQYTARQFEYEIPPTVTQDGRLELKFDAKPVEGTYAASVVSEVWLLKK